MSRECCFPDLHSRARIICQRDKKESKSRSQNIIHQEYVKEHMGHDLANRKHFLLFDLHIYCLAYRRIRCLLTQFNEMKDDHRSYMQKESLKEIQACTGFEPLTSAIPVQRSNN